MQYCDDLEKFVEVIAHYDSDNYIASGIGVLCSTSNEFRYSDSILLQIENVELKIHKKTSGTTPTEVQSLVIHVDCTCGVDLEKDPDQFDIISQYELQIEIIGVAGSKSYINCWHLDKDIPPKDKDVQKHTHPSYHFQSGGRRVEELDTGELLLLGAPRLPHPPMDIFLAVHFIICNFYSRKDFSFVDELFKDYDYQEILERARKRMFEPYFRAFNKDCVHKDFNISKIFPLAV